MTRAVKSTIPSCLMPQLTDCGITYRFCWLVSETCWGIQDYCRSIRPTNGNRNWLKRPLASHAVVIYPAHYHIVFTWPGVWPISHFLSKLLTWSPSYAVRGCQKYKMFAELIFNVDSGYLEGIVRGFKAGILKQADYLNLVQCDTLEGEHNVYNATTVYSIQSPVAVAVTASVSQWQWMSRWMNESHYVPTRFCIWLCACVGDTTSTC